MRAVPPRSGAVACEAPAKINLALHVTGRRDDGYHLLDTVAVFAGAADRLALTPGPVTGLEVDGPFAAALGDDQSENLVLRAVRALAPRMAAGAAEGARLTLTKSLPVAAGIGGGSADAAAALRLGAGFCDPVPTSAELREIALSLGADVPMCLEGVALRARGIGEEIDLLPALPPLSLVLVNPGVGVSTGEIFRSLAGRFGGPLPDPGALSGLRGVLDWLAATRNDLEAPAIAVEPLVGEVLHALRADPACLFARMSGSGATCFGVFESMEAAEGAARHLAAARPGWWVEPTVTRTAPPPVRSAG